MTEAEQNWPDGRAPDAVRDESTGAQAEPAYEDDPIIVEEAPQADPPAEQAHEADPLAEQAHGEDSSAERVHEADPLAEQAHETDPLAEEELEATPPAEHAREAALPAEQVDEGAAGPGSGASGGEEPRPGLVADDGAERFIARWQEIQAGFVDEPRRAVQDADTLVADLMQRLAEMLASERKQLESHWSTGVDVSTEDLRQGLRRYRSLFERLLASLAPGGGVPLDGRAPRRDSRPPADAAQVPPAHPATA